MKRMNWKVVSDNNPRDWTRGFVRFTDALRWCYLELSSGSAVTLSPGIDNRVSTTRFTYGNTPQELQRFVARYGRRA